VTRGNFLYDALLAHEVGELLFIRHGQQQTNTNPDPTRSQGGDQHLSPLGERQAQAVAEVLAAEHVDAIYSSPMLRALDTAAPIATAHGLTPIVDDDLLEIIGFRDIPPGRTVIETIGLDGLDQMHDDFVATRQWDAMPYSETSDQLRARVRRALGRILAAHAEHARIVIVCHGGVLNAVVADLLGTKADMLVMCAQGSITRVARGQGRLALRAMNQDQHLRSPGILTF